MGQERKCEMINLTESAATELKRLLRDNNTPDWGLRVGVRSGGCSGLTYEMGFTEKPEEGDQAIEYEGLKVFIDGKSYLYLYGTTLDYSKDLLTGGFKFVNPNARRSCSCGTSFSA